MMMPTVPLWKKAPCIRYLPALVTGILLQWYMQTSWQPGAILILTGLVSLICFSFFTAFHRFQKNYINGLAVFLLFTGIGILLTWNKDTRKNADWFGHSYKENDGLLVVVQESPVDKPRSWKALATVEAILQDGQPGVCIGKIILYFSKDSLPPVEYGTQLMLTKPLQPIRNAGNPGGFDYERYTHFQGISHQVWLQPADYRILPSTNKQWLPHFIDNTRIWVLEKLRDNIKSPKELGLAEALLIGYKDDLDKDLVQSYTNTGVVHVIAISGLHLGLVYFLLAWLFKPLKRKAGIKWIAILCIIMGLWIFSLLAGAQPSVLRSALMFTCIAIGDGMRRSSSIYNTLAFSAMSLLCINPYWLWDAGFQLSYTAVLSIVLFMKPVYNWFYFKNRIADWIWQLNSVTLAAQVLTIPVCIYHFNQFPNYFLLSNFVAVPLSSAILIGELLLLLFSIIPVIASLLGQLLSFLIQCMNRYIEFIESLPWAVTDGLMISTVQAILLLIAGITISYWLIEKIKPLLYIGLGALLVFLMLNLVSLINAKKQQLLIIYNSQKKLAMDLISGQESRFVADSAIKKEPQLFNFNIRPARIMYRVKKQSGESTDQEYISWGGKRILSLDRSFVLSSASARQTIDLLVLSGKARIYLKELSSVMEIKQVVVTGPFSTALANRWKKDCEELDIPFYDVSVKGAFVMRLR